ncbi:CrcB family protein [Streptomyces sp. NPDC004232]|uniref:CrcB family protein n=1 Tax=unclassified Streptomyces TaxID=2593676 RepID=UPI0033ACE4B1
MNLPMMTAEVVAGALLGHLADRAVRARHDSVVPWGTFVVNSSGRLVLGTFAAVVSTGVTGFHLQLFLDAGLCGAPAPCSAFSGETLRPTRVGSGLYAAVNVVASVAAGLAAALAGFALAGTLFAWLLPYGRA